MSTWVACECGCGFEGEDDVTAYCIEEAVMLAYELHLAAEEQPEEAARQPERKPGEITDPVMADAMRKAKELHAKTFGVQT